MTPRSPQQYSTEERSAAHLGRRGRGLLPVVASRAPTRVLYLAQLLWLRSRAQEHPTFTQCLQTPLLLDHTSPDKAHHLNQRQRPQNNNLSKKASCALILALRGLHRSLHRFALDPERLPHHQQWATTAVAGQPLPCWLQAALPIPAFAPPTCCCPPSSFSIITASIAATGCPLPFPLCDSVVHRPRCTSCHPTAIHQQGL